MVYLLLNCDEYLAAEHLATLKAALGDAEMADLNTTIVEGERIRAADVLAQANMMPFLAPRRLLLVNGYLDQLDKRMAASKNLESAAYVEATHLLEELPHTPDTCDLIFMDASVDKRRHLWKGFSLPASEKKPARKINGVEALAKAQQIKLEALAAPDAKTLPGWIQAHTKARKITVDGRAVQMLADFVGPNLRQLANEIEKLSTYAANRPIVADDVKLLVSDASEALIWDMTDALSQRNTRNAIHSLYELRRGDVNPFYLLTMITRQYRIMIKVKEAMRHGGNEFDVAGRIGEKPYSAKKAMAQANKYSFQELETVMDRLLTADYAMKTGTDPETEIDLLIAELTRK